MVIVVGAGAADIFKRDRRQCDTESFFGLESWSSFARQEEGVIEPKI
jgi:hypothetical protein